MYCLREQAEAVLISTNATADEWKYYVTVLAKFNEFFKVWKNVIFKWVRFNRRTKQEEESGEDNIIALYDLAATTENCNQK